MNGIDFLSSFLFRSQSRQVSDHLFAPSAPFLQSPSLPLHFQELCFEQETSSKSKTLQNMKSSLSFRFFPFSSFNSACLFFFFPVLSYLSSSHSFSSLALSRASPSPSPTPFFVHFPNHSCLLLSLMFQTFSFNLKLKSRLLFLGSSLLFPEV